MKQERNNEIDLLLRRMSRRDGISARDGEALTEHLDADELSSYAQNALPPSARARYTEHLADCSTCRKLVTELSLSLGVAAAAHPVGTVSAPSGLKRFLAALFSPMVLRYAVPALGVIVVMIVGFVVLRRQQHDEFMAQVGVEQKQPAPNAAAPGTAAPTPSGQDSVRGYSDAAEKQVGNTRRPATKADESGAGSGAGVADTASPSAPIVSQREEKAEPAPAPTATPPPAPAAKAAAAEAEAQKKTEAFAKNEAASSVGSVDAAARKETTNQAPRENVRASTATAGNRGDENRPKDTRSERQQLGVVRPASRGRVQSETDESDTRSVSGRRFRKERGIWIDTAYDSSTATVNVARSSEQFRALVADEPGLKTIAEQLDGEVIVVWKGRAYRIR